VKVGSRWQEVDNGRTIVVVSLSQGTNQPRWYYEDDPKREVWHCCGEDFYLWGRFVPLDGEEQT
jgi:hypothetical protein